MMHVEMANGGWTLTLAGVVWGSREWSPFVGVFAWLSATIYNLLGRN